jgi:Gpi18-like mannosyltransferase
MAASATRSEEVGSSRTLILVLIGIAALALRVMFINAEGFKNDVQSFEAWALSLAAHPLGEFYAKTSFADYPPGYFYVLWVIGHLYQPYQALDAQHQYALLKILVKLPAIVMDFVDAGLIYAIVLRFATIRWATIAAAAFLLNPATIFVSAYWGQVDSVATGFMLLALALVLYAERWGARAPYAIAVAWLALGYSVLIKPQGALVGVLLLAFPFATSDPVVRRRRLIGTVLGIVAAVVLADAAALPFAPHLGPGGALGWLFERYRYGSSVYPYNSVNAFNLYAVFRPFWQPDNAPIQIGSFGLGSMWLWGIVLVLAAAVLVVARYLQVRTDAALLEGAMLITFGFFILATRMHERYVFSAFVLLIVLMALNRRFIAGAIVVSFTLLINLVYSLTYLHVMEDHVSGVDPTQIWPMVHPLSALNVAAFFVLGYVYLGGTLDAGDGVERKIVSSVRTWFAPYEGLFAFTRTDYALAAGLTILSFALCVAWYWIPGEKIFDEIYYARAGEEYLKHVELFEWTHPPLTKLLVTLSMMLFGGLHGLGDTSVGWRFLNVVVGALTVWLLYAFAKRLLGSTFFAAVAAGMLTFDGFHFVQSRIATPEITVALFSLATLYAFYRYWTAAQVRREASVTGRFGARFWIVLALGAVAAAGFSWLVNMPGSPASVGARAAAFIYVLAGAYLVARLVLPRFLPDFGARTSYAEGSQVVTGRGQVQVRTARGELVKGEKKFSEEDGLQLTYARTGAMRYTTPAGEARFLPEGFMETVAGSVVPRDGRLWLGLLFLASAAVADSKWNGLFDFFVVWGVVAAVTAQRFVRRPAAWGNPFGFPLDVVVVGMCFVSATIYVLSYIPYFALGHNLNDLVALQQQMFGYHDNLRATHPYGSTWWQWPLLQRPISYYYHDFRTGAALQSSTACCVAEILALPNPAVWWLGLASVPTIAYLAWRERNKGFALLVVAYALQWLPWIATPRVAFEYHFYPNLAVICLANAALLQRVWKRGTWGRPAVWAFLALVVALFVYFYPILAGVGITYDAWHQRMWEPLTKLIGGNWI